MDPKGKIYEKNVLLFFAYEWGTTSGEPIKGEAQYSKRYINNFRQIIQRASVPNNNFLLQRMHSVCRKNVQN